MGWSSKYPPLNASSISHRIREVRFKIIGTKPLASHLGSSSDRSLQVLWKIWVQDLGQLEAPKKNASFITWQLLLKPQRDLSWPFWDDGVFCDPNSKVLKERWPPRIGDKVGVTHWITWWCCYNMGLYYHQVITWNIKWCCKARIQCMVYNWARWFSRVFFPPNQGNLSITMKSQLSKAKNHQELPWRFQSWEGGPPHLSGRFFLITSEGSDGQWRVDSGTQISAGRGGSFQRKMPSWATEK